VLGLRQLAELAERRRDALEAKVREFEIRGRLFAFNETPFVMGVVNLSPDSWYRESVALSADAAIRRGLVLQAQGADLIDIGAESSLLHAERVEAERQCARLLPVVRELSQAGARVSVETYEPAVARACLEAGAAVLNLTGTDPTEEILSLAAEHGAAIVLCFVRGENVRNVTDLPLGGDSMEPILEFFARQTERATRRGVEKILIDPGLGFYYRNLSDGPTRVRRQVEVFLNTFRLKKLGWPVCHALPHAFEYFGEEVRTAEPFFSVLAALGGTNVFRTHEVPKVRAALEVLGLF
jgi:dihydropteroate synthase